MKIYERSLQALPSLVPRVAWLVLLTQIEELARRLSLRLTHIT